MVGPKYGSPSTSISPLNNHGSSCSTAVSRPYAPGPGWIFQGLNRMSQFDCFLAPNAQAINRARLSRSWILGRLKRYWGYGYITTTQPNHPGFPLDWGKQTHLNTRAVFVGSRTALSNLTLRSEISQVQPLYIKDEK